MTVRIGPRPRRSTFADAVEPADAARLRAARRAAEAEATWIHNVVAWCGRGAPADDGERELLLYREVCGDAAIVMQKLVG